MIACDQDGLLGPSDAIEDTGAPDTSLAVPPLLRVEGEAMGESASGEMAACSFFADIGELTFAGDGSWTGTILGGEVFRTITPSASQNRYEFSALIGGPASAEREGDLLRVHIAGEQPPDAVPFWRELATLTGTITGGFDAEGSWICAP